MVEIAVWVFKVWVVVFVVLVVYRIWHPSKTGN